MVARLPVAAGSGSRPVDQLDDLPPLQNPVAVFADMFRLRPMKSPADGQTAGDQEPLARVRSGTRTMPSSA